MFRLRRRLGLWLTAALLALIPLVAQASILDFIPAGPARSSAQQQDEQALFEGKFELAKVRILGVPAITVASPVQLGDQSGIEASVRARVIEGNLRALYDPNQLCSFGERLSEWMLDSLLQSDAHVCTAGQRYGLDRSGTPLTLEVLRNGNGPYELAARLPGREQPFPLLTVTRADAEINGARELALVLELLLLLLFSAMLLLWRRLRQRTSRLHGELRTQGRSDRRSETRLHAEQALSIGVLLLMLYLLVLMIGVLVVAIPGKVPLGIELVLQPSLAVIKFLAVTLAAFLLRSLSTFLLSQWAADVDVPQRLQARRQQRYRSLLSTTHRLINVVGIGVVLLWVLLDIPGVRSASVSLLLAGGALLGALAFVFQGLLRDFSAGLVMLLEDRYAIGDWIEVEGIEGEVIEMGLFSTQIRCLDQRMNILDISSILQMQNHTKLRSGSLVTFVISHRQTDLEIVYRTLAFEIEAFALDPVWGNRLLGDPILRGIKRTTALGVQMQVLLVTRAGEQWTTEREFQRRVLRALHRRGVQLADGLDLGSAQPPMAGGR
ncbi:mechanosensitive ion channel family protein [Parasynechococcus marenigrum]|uniref:Possible mechanosensitive ion channel, MscS family n=1 Tax=Parasynechococcus marenigrum (strain WH8102) TaxID=84588 RepID=Q7U5K2_PARMW|nr:mechanosensitive ion channel domain-containing protein [Parasynechococcus marenigrum]CAE08216.1 possible mechanosensitive ion channel, MscS family [Parasynechococcus marenigrum WH 8102]